MGCLYLILEGLEPTLGGVPVGPPRASGSGTAGSMVMRVRV
jgi:hypothetical protein